MFYKKKYLIGLYDYNNFCISVYDNVEEFFKSCNIKRRHYFYEKICKSNCKEIKFKNCYLCFIDVDEIHNDIFKDEDTIFKEEFNDKFLNNRDWCKINNISERNYYNKRELINNELQR